MTKRIIKRRSPKRTKKSTPKRTIMRRDRPAKQVSPSFQFNARKRKIFYRALRRRLPIMRAVELAGISHQTYRRWFKMGEDRRHPVHRRFRYKVMQIEAANEQECLDIIKNAARGGNQVIENKVVVGPKGTETTRTWKTALPVWQAGAWFLERRLKDEYSRDAIPDSARKSAEEQAAEVKEAYDALDSTVPADAPDVNLPDDMPT